MGTLKNSFSTLGCPFTDEEVGSKEVGNLPSYKRIQVRFSVLQNLI